MLAPRPNDPHDGVDPFEHSAGIGVQSLMTPGSFVRVLICLGLMACGGPREMLAEPSVTQPASEAHGAESTPPRDEHAAQARRCLALVSGCGCADRCGDAFQQSDGSWGVVRPLGNGAPEEVSLGRRCFDDRGTSYEEGSAPASATLCIDVLLEAQFCGGACMPRTDFLRCQLDDDDDCVAAAH